jgi:DNA-binding winged helix-turn-helix (wHTH) protein
VLRRVQSIGTGRIFEVGRRATLDGDGMAEPAHLARETIAFGPFTLLVSERLLKRDGEPVRLGARALDTLIALVSRSNRPVDKRELIAEVWPDAIVAEGSLRFHIASLRKALGDGENGQRYISTLGGRGYCFVARRRRFLPFGATGGCSLYYNRGCRRRWQDDSRSGSRALSE